MRTKVDGRTVLRLIDLLDSDKYVTCIKYLMEKKISVFAPPRVETEHLYKTFIQNPFNNLTSWYVKNEGGLIDKHYYVGMIQQWEYDYETGGIVITKMNGKTVPSIPIQNLYFDIVAFDHFIQFM